MLTDNVELGIGEFVLCGSTLTLVHWYVSFMPDCLLAPISVVFLCL